MRAAVAALALYALFIPSSPAAPVPPTADSTGRQPAAVAADPSGIMVVYPKPDTTVQAASTFIVGSCPPGSTLTCQGKPVLLNAQGFFAHVVELKPGDNSITLVKDGSPQTTRLLAVRREVPEPPLPTGGATIAAGSLEPGQDLGLATGDLLPLSARATPCGQLSVSIAGRRIALGQAATRKQGQAISSVNLGLDTAYGRMYQRHARSQPDLYFGFYRVRADDHWRGVPAQYRLSANGRSTSQTGHAKLTTVEQPLPALTRHVDTIVRVAPGKSRVTPLPQGVRLLIDGWQGTAMRCLLTGGHHVWIEKEDLDFEREPGPPPASTVRTMNVEPEGTGVKIIIPLSQRLPFQLEQQLQPNRVIVRIFGATADTDWVTQNPGVQARLLEDLSWKQAAEGLYELSCHLKRGLQWGFSADYEGTALVVRLKGQPALMPAEKKPLTGSIICLDAGHGGSENGSIGPSGIKESTVNLAITQKLRDLLEAAGARVMMTRDTDTFVSLPDRVRIANQAGAQLLISIHNNALPDGRDPLIEHGTASYWYHPQAKELARQLKERIASATGLPDYGTNFQNLALCRPSNMVSVLVEVGFMINPDEYAQLINPDFQERVARALSSGISDYLRGVNGNIRPSVHNTSPSPVQ